MAVDVKLNGWEETYDFTRRLRAAGVELGKLRASIRSGKPYAHWIEKGRYLHGRPGRRKAGPARMMEKGVRRVRQLTPDAIRRNLPHGPRAVRRGLAGVMSEGTRVVRANTPVVSGKLRASMHTVGV